MTMKELTGKVACITGAAGGIGSAIARAFAGAGTNLALLDLNEEGLSRLANELRGKRTPPISVSTAVADLQYRTGGQIRYRRGPLRFRGIASISWWPTSASSLHSGLRSSHQNSGTTDSRSTSLPTCTPARQRFP